MGSMVFGMVVLVGLLVIGGVGGIVGVDSGVVVFVGGSGRGGVW